MSKIEVNTVEPQCGTNLTVGASGDTITFPSGTTVVNNGSQTGFGREGSVNWQTTIKTGDFTAVSGEGYFINTTGGAVVMTLPSSPSVGDIVAFKDYAGTFQTNNLTINRNSSNIIGEASNKVISVEGQSIVLVYGDATQGWQPVEAATNSDLERVRFITATGGTISTAPCGNIKIHTFTGPGTFCVSQISNTTAENTVGYLVVAGGGGGGGCAGGGGGAGGFREGKNAPVDNFTASPLVASAPTNAVTLTVQGYPITIGGGGNGQPTPSTSAVQGSTSTFSTISSAGGGFGGGRPSFKQGGNGGSGGGNGGDNPSTRPSGNTPPVSPAQGNNGGTNPSPGTFNQGGTGGGGATAVGGDETGPEPGSTKGVNGGAGATTSITGSPVARAGGGGSGGYSGFPGGGGCGGAGGGGRGARPGCSGSPASFAVTGTINTGGGGGAGSNQLPGNNGKGASGGSGIVIIRYKFQ